MTATSWSRYDPRNTVADAPAPRTAPSTTLSRSEFIKDFLREASSTIDCSFVEATLRFISARGRSARSRLLLKLVQVPRLSVHFAGSRRSVVARPSSESLLCFPRPRQYFVSATKVFRAATGMSAVRRSSATATATAAPPHAGASRGASMSRRPRLSANPNAKTACSTKAARCVRDRRRTRDGTRPVRINKEAARGARPPAATSTALAATLEDSVELKYRPAQGPS